MMIQATKSSGFKQLGAKFAPILIIFLAGMAVRTDWAGDHPLISLLLFTWIVADTLMLSLIARSKRTPEWRAILSVLAAASFTIIVALPPTTRALLFATPSLAIAMLVVIVGHVGCALLRAARMYRTEKSNRSAQLFTLASEIFPATLLRFAMAEMRLLHMALFRWGGAADVPANARAFSYHKHLTPICAAILILSAIEIAVYHIIVGHFSQTAAIVMFFLSDIGFIYLVGLVKSFRFKPILLTTDHVQVRAGFLIDKCVPIHTIAAVETGPASDEVRDLRTLNAGLMAWPNVMIRLQRPLPSQTSLFQRRSFERIAFRLDDPESFVRLLRWRLGQNAR